MKKKKILIEIDCNKEKIEPIIDFIGKFEKEKRQEILHELSCEMMQISQKLMKICKE